MGAPVLLRKPIELLGDRASGPGLFSIHVARPLEELLASGGDSRLAIDAQDQRNSYGCTPFPRPTVIDFGSSTASNISKQAFAHAQAAQAQIWLAATLKGEQAAFDDRMEEARNALRVHLGATGAEIVFSPSGTDAQLQALYLIKALLGTPLVTIIAGADQTGSGTAHTALGRHFSDRTSLGADVEKGKPIAGLSDQVRTVGIPFCDEAGNLRSDAEMDAAVYAAVAGAVGRGEKVLLQVMDASKLGWRGPSGTCIAAIVAAWPSDVSILVDACQMRIGRPQLRNYLERGYFVLATGSKYFTGPAFCGALLVPGVLAGAIDDIVAAPLGLGSYSTRYDWPRRWHHLRQALPAEPNYGQWLRWEATLVEMDAYFSVPTAFRHDLLKAFAVQVPLLIGASKNLQLLAEQCGITDFRLSDEMCHRTIFPFVPHQDGQPLSLARCISLYRAMGRDLSGVLAQAAPDAMHRIAEHICQIGQPVGLRHMPGAALRLSASARLVSSCWARAATLEDALAPVFADMRAVFEKIDWLIAHPEICESEAT
jgi:hypothetical protein